MFENPKVNIKIKLATLWASVTFCYLYGDYFELYTPDKVNSLISGDNLLGIQTTLLIASIILAIPSIMVALSIFLKPKINRILNILFGILFTIMMIFASRKNKPLRSQKSVFYIFNRNGANETRSCRRSWIMS